MNKYGGFSILMVALSILAFFVLRGPNANLYLIIVILSVFSVLGIVLAVLSKKLVAVTLGIFLNGGLLVFTYLLLLTLGMSEP
ncbi:hypothetical protein [Halobacillus sp. Marseille-P3879]|uniref:hypothetical protein n=1 Tax=Halobacillus sp. Marseille-P3879 TaxID=2045014 RepID=UPI000C7D6F76|nr:hypothetical protein [Halobacillus sp. Marseille-P3879]